MSEHGHDSLFGYRSIHRGPLSSLPTVEDVTGE
jgi:hypothetical protein